MSSVSSSPTTVPTSTSESSTSSSGSATPSSATSRGVQLKKSLAGHDADIQFAMLAPGAVQRAGGGGGEDTAAVHEAAAAGIASGGGAMPHAGQIQQAFGGHDISNVQAHTGAAASQANQAMGAEAYATGNHVAFGSAPDLHTAAHEAAHVVQQQHGVSLGGGVGQVGDSYEQHADAVADKVVKGESAEGLLSSMTGGAPKGGEVQQKSLGAVQRRAVQRDGTTPGPAPASTPAAAPGATPAQAPATAPGATPTVAPGSTPAPAPGATPAAAPGSAPAAAPHPAAADIAADRAALAPVAKLPDYAAKIASLRVAPTATSKASVALRIGKLMTAIPATRTALNTFYGAGGPAKAKAFIDDRLALIEANLATYVAKATSALSAIEAKGSVDSKDQFDATGPIVFFPAMGIEEATTLDVLRDVTKGVIKVFDANSIWGAMDPAFQAGWTTHGGGQAGWLSACKSAGRLVFAPTGKETIPPFAGKGAADAFKGTVRGFVGMGTDAPVPTSYAHAIQHFALNESWYPSKVMFLGHCTVSYLAGLVGAIPIGKPSIFKLLQFDENTYEPGDRTFGHLADPKDPSKPGNALELQTDGLPQSEFLSGGSVLS